MSTRSDVKNVYRQTEVVDYYSTTKELTAAEKHLLERIRSAIAGKAILDIGIGTGRTTPYLMAISADYTGIDYAPEMVERAKQLHPTADILECDARDLSRFGAARFDFVLFSFNGIDSVSHEDRLVILRQIYASLRPGGMFCFSSHNLASRPRPAYSLENLHLSANPLRLLAGLRYYLTGVLNDLSSRRGKVSTADYALLTDMATNYRGLNYYVSKAMQVEQLERIGFSDIELIDLEGVPTRVQNTDLDRWIYYVARKPA
jgi:SAM-dependent methyltransferase